MHPWRAYKTLEWLIFTGFALAGFFALVAVAMLYGIANQNKVAVVTVSQPALPTPQATPTGLDPTGWQGLNITDADLVCSNPADCAVVVPDCGGCGSDIAVNTAAASRIESERQERCKDWRGISRCLRESSLQPYCVAGRCTKTPPVTPGTTSWQRYRNDRYGYEVRYPAWLQTRGWRESDTYENPSPVTTRDSSVQFIYSTPAGLTRAPFSITVVSIEQAISVENFISPPYYNNGHTRRLVGTIQIDGRTTNVVEDCSDLGCFATGVLNTPDFQYQITVPSETDLASDDGVLQQQIISTFKFTK